MGKKGLGFSRTLAARKAREQQATAVDARWLGTEEFAELSGITPQAARRALRLGIKGGAWRAHPIVVRHRYGRGGRTGVGYEVALESLPASLRLAASAWVSEMVLAGTAADLRRAAGNQGAAIADRWAAIRDAVSHPPNSLLRAVAVMASTESTGRSKRTIYRWIKQHEAHGLRGLARARASNANTPRVFVSRQFDRAARAAGYGDDVLREIAATVRASLKGL
jgi:hypothetical protein